MQKNESITVIGGDARMGYAARALERAGYFVTHIGFERSGNEPAGDRAGNEGYSSGAYLLPMPLTKDGKNVFAPFSGRTLPLSETQRRIPDGATVFFGGGGAFGRDLRLRGVTTVDYAADETLQRKNAALTAEGLLALFIAETPYSIKKAPVAVTGGGRVAYETARLFAACGAAPVCFARREAQLSELRKAGIRAMPLSALGTIETRFVSVVNTVPARILNASVLRALGRDCVILEAASAPGGADPAEAAAYGLRLVPAPALPGRFCPESAGLNIADAVMEKLGR